MWSVAVHWTNWINYHARIKHNANLNFNGTLKEQRTIKRVFAAGWRACPEQHLWIIYRFIVLIIRPCVRWFVVVVCKSGIIVTHSANTCRSLSGKTSKWKCANDDVYSPNDSRKNSAHTPSIRQLGGSKSVGRYVCYRLKKDTAAYKFLIYFIRIY